MDEKENRLVELVLAGQTDAFEPLVRPYRSALLGLAYRLMGDAEEAKEACQEALFRAYRYLHSFDRAQSFRNWLLGILVNCARTLAGKRGVRTRAERALLDQARRTPEDSGPAPEAGEIRSRLMEALGALTKREREVFLLRDLEEKTIGETADILGCSGLSVRVHLSAARKKLRDELRS